jgi:uncharacterized protein
MDKILITGGSGLVGTRLTEMLTDKGYSVAHLGRSERISEIPIFIWDPKSQMIDASALTGVDTIIHLAGANVGGKPWTARRKQEILESRTRSTRLLYDFLKSNKHGVRNFISASAVGYYGFDTDGKVHYENDPPGDGFLAEVVKQWEAEVDRIGTLGIRVVKVRIGIVLSRNEGALKEMARPVKWFVGAPLGSGDQMISWIHIDDVCRVFMHALENESMKGAVNAVAQEPVSNRKLTRAIASALGKPLFLPAIPAFALKLLLGEMADLVLQGSTVSNRRLRQENFRYSFPTLDGALADLLSDHS